MSDDQVTGAAAPELAAAGRIAWDAYEAATGDPTNPVSFAMLRPESKELWARIEKATQASLSARVSEIEQQLAEVLGAFKKTSDGMRARASQVVFGRWCDQARVPLPEGVHR